jgi:DNA mismatch repair protein MutL
MMSDIIQLLPDSVANQIAAGEVIQRPSSAVKELMENSIDSGATSIKLILREAGKSFLQVVDNGMGMSETDARMSFERHATSKIRKAEDLFSIKTMGFRGEALASIAAIAQVELKTKRAEDETGTLIEIEGSEVKIQEPCSGNNGTSIAVKNLFYNIPARRNFLKSNQVELRHIIDEFQRQALAHPDLFFSLHHDGNELFHLTPGSLKHRIINIFGANYSERLVPVEEQTEIVSIRGYIGKPEHARKTRGEQYFFVNNRFIKDAYLNHAVANAFEDLLPADSFPLYVLFIEINPSRIDINVHPTKTEIKFDDEKSVYAIIRSTVKRSLGKYNITPTLDFNTENSFGNLKPFDPKTDEIRIPTIKVNPDFNPFEEEKTNSKNQHTNSGNQYATRNTQYENNTRGWEKLYDIARSKEEGQLNITPEENTIAAGTVSEKQTYQLHNRFIVSPIKTGIMIIDQQAAHERILYERFLDSLENSQGASQQCLFPQSIELNTSDFELAKELLDDLRLMGFDINEFGKNTIVVYGVPAEIESGSEEQIILGLLENYKQNLSILKLEKRENIARSLARNAAIKAGKELTKEEMNLLIDELFACKMPQAAINGKSTLIKLSLEELLKRF